MNMVLRFTSVGLFYFSSQLVLAGDLTPEQKLGEQLFFDNTLSINNNQACFSCHDPSAGFADPRNTADPANSPVSPGSISGQFGTRNAPSTAYARFSPSFHWDSAEGLYKGGQFWDGRDDNLAGQASRPPTNPVEMALGNKSEVVNKLLLKSEYQNDFFEVYDIDLKAASTTHAGVLATYDRMAQAIGEFEKTQTFSKFSSKFDYWLAGEYEMTKQEERGMKLFNNKAKCNLCHLSDVQMAADGETLFPPLFTDFTYDNLGIPVNQKIAELRGETVAVDYGLGGRADIAKVDPVLIDGTKVSAGQAGKFKVMTLRNIELTPPYGHNGFFTTLEEIVHFYNTRDTLADCAVHSLPQIGVNCWPAPEVTLNVNTDELGDLHLTEQQEADVVAFLKTLTDGYGKPLNIILPPSP